MKRPRHTIIGRLWVSGDSVHRVGGPAHEHDNGYKAWAIRGDVRLAQDGLGTREWAPWSAETIHDESGPFFPMNFPGYETQ